MKRFLQKCCIFLLFFSLLITLALALPPPPPPTPGSPGGSEEVADVPEETFIPEMEVQEGVEDHSTTSLESSDLVSRVAVLEHRMNTLEQRGISNWVLFLIAVNVVVLGLIIYLLLHRPLRDNA